jgi:phage-related tail protein
MEIVWQNAPLGVITLYVIWDVVKRFLDINKKDTNMTQLINFIEKRDSQGLQQNELLIENLRELALKMDSFVMALGRNTEKYVETMAKDEKNTENLKHNISEINESIRRIHNRIDEMGKDVTRIEAYTRSCLQYRRGDEDYDG